MHGYIYMILGLICSIIAGLLWLYQDKNHKLINGWIIMSIILLLFGTFNILLCINHYVHAFRKTKGMPEIIQKASTWEWIFIIGLIFLGSISYTIAAYFHLKLEKWSFLMAFAIALPLILIEYQFSIRGNHAAKNILKLNIVQITLLTVTFYFINSWILNYFVLKQPMIWWRESLAFIFIILAFILTTRSN